MPGGTHTQGFGARIAAMPIPPSAVTNARWPAWRGGSGHGRPIIATGPAPSMERLKKYRANFRPNTAVPSRPT